MKTYDESVEINPNPDWLYIPHHLYRILITGGSGSGKTNVLLKLIRYQRSDIDIYLYVEDRFESKYQLLINGREKVDIKKLKNQNHWLFTNNWCLWCNKDYNATRKEKKLKVFGVIADIKADKELSLSHWIAIEKQKAEHFHNLISKCLKL